MVAARAAVNLWRDAGAPYEAAQTQQLLAEVAVRTGDREVATVELDAALAVFKVLGAARDIEAAQRMRDRLGDATLGRQVRRTFMFTDIVDSTQHVASMGDEQWAAVLRAHDRTIRDLLARHRGAEVKQRGGGDGFFAVFESPADAIECAVAIQRAFAEQRERAFVPEIRIGVHEADALLSANDYAGLGVHAAARIGAHAGAGGILTSAATAASAGTKLVSPAARCRVQGPERPRRGAGRPVERREGGSVMTETYELRNMIEDEQVEFAEMLRGLLPEQWETPSLCKGWSVHDAVIHIAWHEHVAPVARVAELARVRFSEDRQMEPSRSKSKAELVDWLASPAKVGGRNDTLTQLSEIVIHQQDVRRPLGLDRKIPADRLGVVLDFGVSVAGLTFTMAFSRKRAKGLRLVAPDVGWWSGSGPEVRGPGEAILMALNGRGDALADLTGDGVPALAGRIEP